MQRCNTNWSPLLDRLELADAGCRPWWDLNVVGPFGSKSDWSAAVGGALCRA
jgi:hypothetical protein